MKSNFYFDSVLWLRISISTSLAPVEVDNGCKSIFIVIPVFMGNEFASSPKSPSFSQSTIFSLRFKSMGFSRKYGIMPFTRALRISEPMESQLKFEISLSIHLQH